ncbi:MAG: XTP/dITP diphosphatase [Kiritimatiellia bacterium]
MQKNAPKLLIATRNRHKLDEFQKLFGAHVEITSGLDFPHLPDVVEDGDTFEANAVKKAVTLAKSTGLWALADDSGLEVDALGGKPGVYSARYAGEPTDYHANNRKLLKDLSGVTNRRARFVCVMALSDPSGRAQTVRGTCEGQIIHETRGAHGFGYDPLFVPDGHEQTFAELGDEIKNSISHRANALKKAREQWEHFLDGRHKSW